MIEDGGFACIGQAEYEYFEIFLGTEEPVPESTKDATHNMFIILKLSSDRFWRKGPQRKKCMHITVFEYTTRLIPDSFPIPNCFSF